MGIFLWNAGRAGCVQAVMKVPDDLELTQEQLAYLSGLVDDGARRRQIAVWRQWRNGTYWETSARRGHRVTRVERR
ncbi:hypothetical protein [Nocardia sp. NPDC048505]|uniref:hypothetical protein n=1 Tax=unclassified Nocardia TaxID=2637762 RepID=UPI0033D8ED2D